MSKYRSLFIVAAAACGTAPAQPATHDLSWSAETVLATPRLLRASNDSSTRSTLLLRPVSIRANRHAIVIADVGDDRILVVDSAGNVTRSFGSRGRGPGELLGVSHMTLRDSSVLVGEAVNGRVSEFTLAGTFVATHAAGFAAGAVAANAREIFSAARSNDFYATLIRPDAPPGNALRRPALAASEGRQRWARLPGHDLIVSDTSRTWVFDQGRGILCAYDEPYSQPNCLSLPPHMLARLRRYRQDRVDRLEQSIRMRVEVAPLAKDVLLVGRYVALLVPLPDVPVLLIRSADGTLTPVMTLGNPPSGLGAIGAKPCVGTPQPSCWSGNHGLGPL